VKDRGMEYPRIDRDDMNRWAEAFQEPAAEELELFDPPLT